MKAGLNGSLASSSSSKTVVTLFLIQIVCPVNWQLRRAVCLAGVKGALNGLQLIQGGRSCSFQFLVTITRVSSEFRVVGVVKLFPYRFINCWEYFWQMWFHLMKTAHVPPPPPTRRALSVLRDGTWLWVAINTINHREREQYPCKLCVEGTKRQSRATFPKDVIALDMHFREPNRIALFKSLHSLNGGGGGWSHEL